MDTSRVRTQLDIHPLTPARWNDLEALFGRSGASGGCWCMWWRVPNKEYDRGAGNKAAFRSLTETQCGQGFAPGLLGYMDGAPVGWISLGPRADYRRFESMRSDAFKPVDATPVWSIVCFFIHAKQRRRGSAAAMLQGAIDYGRAQGAQVLEAYPTEVIGKPSSGNIFMGTQSLFVAASFEEVARRKPERPIMRLAL